MARRLKARLYMRRWNATNKDWVAVKRALKNYGITLDQYHAKAESQDFMCAICRDDKAPLRVDHDHVTGRFRGLLCDMCNVGLGHFRRFNTISGSGISLLGEVRTVGRGLVSDEGAPGYAPLVAHALQIAERGAGRTMRVTS